MEAWNSRHNYAGAEEFSFAKVKCELAEFMSSTHGVNDTSIRRVRPFIRGASTIKPQV